jgi:hypothetical protein
VNCPSCNKKAINFDKWCMGSNAFKTKCQHCNKELKAGMLIYVGFLFTLALVGVCIPFLSDVWRFIGYAPSRSQFEGLILFIPAFLGAAGTWCFGSYIVKSGI